MNEIIIALLKNIDVKQVNELLGKLVKNDDGSINTELVGKIAGLIGANKDGLMSVLPGIMSRSGGQLDTETLLTSIDMKELAKIIPAAGAVKVVHDASKFAAKKIDAETDKIQVAENEHWKGTTAKEITAAADKAAEYAETEVGESISEAELKVLKTYRDFAQGARDSAIARKEVLLKTGADKFSDPVAEMNKAMIKASQALRKLEEKIAAAEK